MSSTGAPTEEDLRARDGLADVPDAAVDGAESDQLGARGGGDDPGERGLPRPRRTPEDERGDLVGLDRLAQQRVGSEDVLLADHLLEGARPHPLGERDHARVARRRGAEQVARLAAP